MTLKELYETIGGDYEQALRVLRMDKLVDKHIRKYVKNGVVEKLIDAGFTLNPKNDQTSNDNQRNACGVDQSEKTTTDEDDRPPLELTGE